MIPRPGAPSVERQVGSRQRGETGRPNHGVVLRRPGNGRGGLRSGTCAHGVNLPAQGCPASVDRAQHHARGTVLPPRLADPSQTSFTAPATGAHPLTSAFAGALALRHLRIGGTVNDMPPTKPVSVGYVRGDVRQAILWHLRRGCRLGAADGTHHRHTNPTLTGLATTLANRGHQPCLRCTALPVLSDAGEHLAGPGLHYVMCSYGHGEASRCDRCATLTAYAELSHGLATCCQGRVMLLIPGVLDEDAERLLHALYLDVDSLAGPDLPSLDVWEVAAALLLDGADFATALHAATALHNEPRTRAPSPS